MEIIYRCPLALLFPSLSNMFVKCLTIIKDPVLANNISHYIYRTPFLTNDHVDGKTLHLGGHITAEIDLIILEATSLSPKTLKGLMENHGEKYFIVLSDLLLFLNLDFTAQTRILPKNVSYTVFIDALSDLATEKKTYSRKVSTR